MLIRGECHLSSVGSELVVGEGSDSFRSSAFNSSPICRLSIVDEPKTRPRVSGYAFELASLDSRALVMNAGPFSYEARAVEVRDMSTPLQDWIVVKMSMVVGRSVVVKGSIFMEGRGGDVYQRKYEMWPEKDRSFLPRTIELTYH